MATRPQHGLAERAGTDADVFRRAFHNSPVMQSIVRLADSVIVEVNATFSKVLGYAREEVVGRTPFELNFWVKPELLPEFRAQLEARGGVRDFEVEARAKDGSVRTLLLSADLVDIGGVIHSMSAGIDITGRKETEAKLRESERRLRESEAQLGTAFRASPVMMTIARLSDGRFVEVNDAFVAALGLTRAEVIGHSTTELNVWLDLMDRAKFYEEVMRAGSLRNVDCRVRRRDGTEVTIQVSAEIVEINRVPHLLTFGVDITQQRLAEAEQERALQRERELSQLRSDFVSLVSHEFRTPLEIIMSSVDNLGRYHDRLPAEKRQDLLATINKSVRRMAGMMEEVLLLGRLDSGGTEFKPAPLDLANLCRRVCDEMESATSRRCPIALTLALERNGRVEACGDEAVLRHILTNLLSNAVKYSPPGEPVDVGVTVDHTLAVVRVADRGCGIPAADQRQLFQAFHRGSNVRQIPGTGLGLLIVRRCVGLHGGTIVFDSAEGRGTTFTVRLPLFGERT